MQRIREDWENARADLEEALIFNRKIWQVFLTSVTSEDHPMPRELRENVANLGIFVLKQTQKMHTAPDPRLLDALININRELVAGLRAQPNAA